MKAQEIFSKALLMPELNGMSVFVTRAAHQAEELCQLIEAAGGRPIRFPVTRIEPVAATHPQIVSALPHVASMDAIVFVSPNAVQHGLELLKNQEIKLSPRSSLFAIGPGTKRSLAERGFSNILMPLEHFDSQALLALPELRDVSQKKILIIRGEAGREELALELERRGGRVFHLPCYRREPEERVNEESLSLWEAGSGDVLLITSTSSIDHLRLILGDKIIRLLKGMIIVMASRRIARHWQAASLPGKVIIADNASPTKLIAAIKKYEDEMLS
jgi:uroporphyrinogen-III synthase